MFWFFLRAAIKTVLFVASEKPFCMSYEVILGSTGTDGLTHTKVLSKLDDTKTKWHLKTERPT